MSRSEREIFLGKWLDQYCGVYKASDTAEELKARQPLRETMVYVNEIPGKPDEYRAVMFIRPVYQLEELLVAMRTVVYLPDPRLINEANQE